MILIGHALIPHAPFYHITTCEQIAQTPSGSTLLFEFDAILANYCKEQRVAFAMHVKQIKELVLAHAMGASFCVVDKALAAHAQKIAEAYLYDAKILLISHDEADIEFAATHGIDGILFEEGIQTL